MERFINKSFLVLLHAPDEFSQYLVRQGECIQTLHRSGQDVLPGVQASIVAAGRQGIFLIPALLTLPRFLGILGLQLCQPIADVCTSVMAAVIVVSILKELKVWNEEIQNLSKKTMDE